MIAAPHGFCAGVQRAIDTADALLEQRGAPVYCLHEIVHNEIVVGHLRNRGIVFVDRVDDVPVGSCLLFSAHGISPEVRQTARARQLDVVDATCPFVEKVHREVRRYASEGYSVLLVGHRGHEEVEGVRGEAPESVSVVENTEEARTVRVDDPAMVAVVTQTTLAQSHAAAVTAALKERFPQLKRPPGSDICYATTNRQEAAVQVATRADLVLVLGSDNSANAQRLVEVSEEAGTPAKLLGNIQALEAMDLTDVWTVGLTASASTPQSFVYEALDILRGHGYVEHTVVSVTDEGMSFPLPRNLKG